MNQSKISIGELNTATKEIRESLADLQAILEFLEEEHPESAAYAKIQHNLFQVFRGVNRVLHLAYRATR